MAHNYDQRLIERQWDNMRIVRTKSSLFVVVKRGPHAQFPGINWIIATIICCMLPTMENRQVEIKHKTVHLLQT